MDADAHVNPPHDFWVGLPALEQFRDLAPPRVEHGEDADYIVFEGARRKMNLLGAQAGRTGKDFKVEGRRSDMRAGGWMPAARIADMDLDGMTASVLFGGGPLGSKNVELYIESFAAYNRWLSDFCSYDMRRLIGVGYVPMRDVDESIRMMKECKALGFNSVNIPAFPQAKEANKTTGDTGAIASMGAQAAALTGDPHGARQYNQPEFDPFWGGGGRSGHDPDDPPRRAHRALREQGSLPLRHADGPSIRWPSRSRDPDLRRRVHAPSHAALHDG